MSTELLPMQSFGAFGGRVPEFDMKMASDVTGVYSPQDCWGPSFGNEPRPLAADYMQFQPATTSSGGSQPQYANITTGSGFSALSSLATPPIFTAEDPMSQPQNAATVTPLQTHLDPNQPSPDSYNGSTYNEPDTYKSTSYSDSSSKQRKDSFSPTTRPLNGGRRRKSESVEIGSARAIYLEKNRKAASKCRSKQKRQQEELVVEAREVERKNKLLKAEVEILKDGMRELFEVVARHSECPDSRLELYLQRRADRLAIASSNDFSYTHQHQGVSPASYGTLSPDATSPLKPQ